MPWLSTWRHFFEGEFYGGQVSWATSKPYTRKPILPLSLQRYFLLGCRGCLKFVCEKFGCRFFFARLLVPSIFRLFVAKMKRAGLFLLLFLSLLSSIDFCKTSSDLRGHTILSISVYLAIQRARVGGWNFPSISNPCIVIQVTTSYILTGTTALK